MEREPLIAWEAPEYEEKDHSPDWFWAVGIIAVAFAVTAIIFKNFLFAILILLAAFTLSLFASRKPRHVRFELNRKGVVVDEKLYPYATLESFHIHENRRPYRLVFVSEKFFMPHITLPLPDDIDPDDLADFLEQFLPEKEHTDSVAEAVMEYLGF